MKSLNTTADNHPLKILKETATYIIDNFFRTAPESMLFGSAAIAILLQNMSFFILTLAILVFKLVNGFLGKFFLETFPDMGALYAGEVMDNRGKCEFNNDTIEKLEGLNSVLRSSAFPSSTSFIFLSTLFYCMRSVHAFQDELTVLGEQNPAFKGIAPTSLVLTLVFMVIYILWRNANGCESPQQLLLLLLGAAIVGSLVSVVFEMIFGKYGINLLNMPILELDSVAVGSLSKCQPAGSAATN
jgi:hypothetical protein